MNKAFEKIIDKLEEEKMSYFLTIANTGDEKLDYSYEQVGNALDKAIEIVKQFGISDDVCEWKDGAIDDFANVLKENYDYLPQILSQESFGLYIDEYAEKLKAGVKE